MAETPPPVIVAWFETRADIEITQEEGTWRAAGPNCSVTFSAGEFEIDFEGSGPGAYTTIRTVVPAEAVSVTDQKTDATETSGTSRQLQIRVDRTTIRLNHTSDDDQARFDDFLQTAEQQSALNN